MIFDVPETIPVGHRVHRAGELDAHRVPKATWDAPVTRYCYGIGPASTSDPITVGASQVIIDAQMFSTWKVHHKDKIDVDGRTFMVEGDSQNYNLGPFGFRPGYVTSLRYA